MNIGALATWYDIIRWKANYDWDRMRDIRKKLMFVYHQTISIVGWHAINFWDRKKNRIQWMGKNCVMPFKTWKIQHIPSGISIFGESWFIIALFLKTNSLSDNRCFEKKQSY